jgi:hypothetical protein
VRFKLDLLEAAMPAESALVFGDMYIVEGAYTEACITQGCSRAVLIDTLETQGWLDARARHPQLDFYKGDFSDPIFMASVREHFSIRIVFDILLHQAPLVATVHLMLEKVDALVIAQPVLTERETANSLVYLPGQPADCGLYPLADRSEEYQAFDLGEVNHSHWLWGITPSFFRSLLAGEGFEVAHEVVGAELENPQWNWWGCIARRGRANPRHWSHVRPTPGLFEASW